MQRPLESILHVDMDAFFAAVEQRDDPDLVGQPVAVGGAAGRGVVAAASYEARAFGVTSAMPMGQARRLCPALIVRPPRIWRYRQVSGQVMDILESFTPLVEPLSLDEAFLDVAGAHRLFGSPITIARQIRQRVASVTGLTCSVGVGPSKFVAKLLSDLAKPDGSLHWPQHEVVARLRPLATSRLWGAGPKSVERLARHGIHTIGQVADADPRLLVHIVGEALGGQLHRLAQGHDERDVTVARPRRSVSAEETYPDDVFDTQVHQRRVMHLSQTVGRRLRETGLATRTVVLKARTDGFVTVTRSHSLAEATCRTRDVAEIATDLLDGLRLADQPVRLLGVAATNLVALTEGGQLTLDNEIEPAAHQRWGDLERIADEVAARYEGMRVQPAALFEDASTNRHSAVRAHRERRTATPPR